MFLLLLLVRLFVFVGFLVVFGCFCCFFALFFGVVAAVFGSFFGVFVVGFGAFWVVFWCFCSFFASFRRGQYFNCDCFFVNPEALSGRVAERGILNFASGCQDIVSPHRWSGNRAFIGISQKGSPERCRFRFFPFSSVFFCFFFFRFLPFPFFSPFWLFFFGFRFFPFFLSVFFCFFPFHIFKQKPGDTVRETPFAKPRFHTNPTPHSLLKHDQIMLDDRLPLQCRRVVVGASSYCHPGHHASVVTPGLNLHNVQRCPRQTVRNFMTSSGCSMEGPLPKKKTVPTVLGVA